jgi:hypothetical protein
MKNTDIRIYFLYVLFFYNQLYWEKNNKHNAVFQHIPTEIDDVVITKFQNRPCYLRFLMKEKMGG